MEFDTRRWGWLQGRANQVTRRNREPQNGLGKLKTAWLASSLAASTLDGGKLKLLGEDTARKFANRQGMYRFQNFCQCRFLL